MNFNQYNNAYSNNDMEKLDEIARKMNNKKAHNAAINNKKTFEIDTIQGLNAMSENHGYGYLSELSKGDFSSSLPSGSQNSSQNDSQNNSQNNSCENISSIYSDNISMDSDISSNYSLLPQQSKSEFKLKSNHLKKYKNTSTNDDEILKHISTCDECKKQLLESLRNNNHLFPQQSQQSQQSNDQKNILGLTYDEIKNVIILLIIGIIIIITLDILLR